MVQVNVSTNMVVTRGLKTNEENAAELKQITEDVDQTLKSNRQNLYKNK